MAATGPRQKAKESAESYTDNDEKRTLRKPRADKRDGKQVQKIKGRVHQQDHQAQLSDC